jgi:hypothetical protein
MFVVGAEIFFKAIGSEMCDGISAVVFVFLLVDFLLFYS